MNGETMEEKQWKKLNTHITRWFDFHDLEVIICTDAEHVHVEILRESFLRTIVIAVLITAVVVILPIQLLQSRLEISLQTTLAILVPYRRTQCFELFLKTIAFALN